MNSAPDNPAALRTSARRLPRVGGRCDPAFRLLGQHFVERLAEVELGAALAVSLDGRLVVDLWGGWMDRRRQVPWRRDTLVSLFSASKGLSALCVLQAAERGLLDLDAPLARVWPEFSGAARDAVTLRGCLDHSAGMIGFDPAADLPFEALYDWPRVVSVLAATKPWWPPGDGHGYHARTQGFLLGEALRRVCGHTLGAWLAREVAGLADLDLLLGVPPSELGRCAELVPAALGPDPAAEALLRAMREDSLAAVAFARPPAPRGYMNSEAFRRAELPAMNVHGTARALASVYGALALGGAPFVGSEFLAEATRPQREGADRVLGRSTCFGLGFMLSRPALAFGTSDAAFGHPGAGGSLAFADPSRRLGFAFVVNRMEPGVLAGGSSAHALVAALEEVL
jgi:CubicO group peptidase (beta-lactamase class C family)